MPLFPPVPQAHHRALTCTRCGTLVGVIEAATGARTNEQHQWVDAQRYVCGDCQVKRHEDKADKKAAQPEPVPYGVIPF